MPTRPKLKAPEHTQDRIRMQVPLALSLDEIQRAEGIREKRIAEKTAENLATMQKPGLRAVRATPEQLSSEATRQAVNWDARTNKPMDTQVRELLGDLTIGVGTSYPIASLMKPTTGSRPMLKATRDPRMGTSHLARRHRNTMGGNRSLVDFDETLMRALDEGNFARVSDISLDDLYRSSARSAARRDVGNMLDVDLLEAQGRGLSRLDRMFKDAHWDIAFQNKFGNIPDFLKLHKFDQRSMAHAMDQLVANMDVGDAHFTLNMISNMFPNPANKKSLINYKRLWDTGLNTAVPGAIATKALSNE